MNRGKTRPALLGIVLALALAGTGRADYLESFKDGYRAVELKQWQDAVWSMREAAGQKRQNPHENVRVYGTILVPYIPNYFLGLALYRQGDCAGALTAFEEAEARGMIRGLYRSRLKAYHRICADRLGVTRQIAQLPVRPSPGINNRPTPPVPPPPDPGLPTTSIEVRKKALQKAVREGQEFFAKGDKVVSSLKQKRPRNPVRAQDLKSAEKNLETARFQLEACRREGDLDGAEEARNDAEATVEILAELEKGW